MNTRQMNRREFDDRMMGAGWWMLATATAMVLAVGSLGFAPRVSGQPARTELSETASEHRDYVLKQQVLAIHRLLHDKRWRHIDQREGLCGALYDSVRTARASGAIPAQFASTAWVQGGRVQSGLADAALAAQRDDLSRLGRLHRLLLDRRWAIPHQRGPLCNALVTTEGEAPAVS